MGWKRKLYKLVFAGPMQTVGHGVDADLQALLSFPTPRGPYSLQTCPVTLHSRNKPSI